MFKSGESNYFITQISETLKPLAICRTGIFPVISIVFFFFFRHSTAAVAAESNANNGRRLRTREMRTLAATVVVKATQTITIHHRPRKSRGERGQPPYKSERSLIRVRRGNGAQHGGTRTLKMFVRNSRYYKPIIIVRNIPNKPPTDHSCFHFVSNASRRLAPSGV